VKLIPINVRHLVPFFSVTRQP